MAKSWSRMGMGGWWIFERGRASGEGAGTGACVWGGGEGVRIWAFWLWDFGIIRKLHRFCAVLREKYIALYAICELFISLNT